MVVNSDPPPSDPLVLNAENRKAGWGMQEEEMLIGRLRQYDANLEMV